MISFCSRPKLYWHLFRFFYSRYGFQIAAQNGGGKRSCGTRGGTLVTEVHAFPSTLPSPTACTHRCISPSPPCLITTGRCRKWMLIIKFEKRKRRRKKGGEAEEENWKIPARICVLITNSPTDSDYFEFEQKSTTTTTSTITTTNYINRKENNQKVSWTRTNYRNKIDNFNQFSTRTVLAKQLTFTNTIHCLRAYSYTLPNVITIYSLWIIVCTLGFAIYWVWASKNWQM